MKAQQKKLSGCASNLLAHEDLGHLRRPIVGIYKPSSIMKIPTSIWKWQNKRLSIMKIMVLLWSTSVAKDSSIIPSLLFSHFFGLLFFYWPFSFLGLLFFLFGLSLFFLTRDNALIMMIIILLFIYNSRITTQYLEQNMTLCECLRRCTGMCNDLA